MSQVIKFAENSSGMKNVLYIGDDSHYWENVKKTFEKTYSLNNFLYYQYETDKTISYKVFFQKAYKFLPSIIYIDLSKDTVRMLKLARLISREVKFRTTSIVGLVDGKRGIFEALAANCDYVHVKCGEFHDVVYGPIRLTFPLVAKEPQFARAITEEKEEVFYPARIGYMTKDYIHLESNAKLEEQREYLISSEVSKKDLPSKKFTLGELTSSAGHYYTTKYSYNIKPKYFDLPPLLQEVEDLKARGKKITVDQDSIDVFQKEYEEGIEIAKKSFEKYILNQREYGFEKQIRIFICDSTYSVLDQTDEDLSSTPYAFRLASSMTEDMDEIKTIKPNLLAIQFEEEVTEEEEKKVEQQTTTPVSAEDSGEEVDTTNRKNKKQWIDNLAREEEKKVEEKKKSKNLQLVKKLKSVIGEVKDYKPVIIIFNSSYSSESIQQYTGYPLFICHREPVNLKVIEDMAILLQKKMKKDEQAELVHKLEITKAGNPNKNRLLRVKDIEEKKYFVSKRNKLSKMKIHLPITVVGLTESEIWFKCQDKLEYGHYELNFPSNVMITLVFDKDTGNLVTNLNGENCYQGVFHCYDEDDKKEIRKKVNQIFFTDLINQRKVESLEYEKVTKEALDKKLNELEEMKKLLEIAEIKKSSNG